MFMVSGVLRAPYYNQERWLPFSISLAESPDLITVDVSVADSVVIECLGSETRHLSWSPGSPCTSKSCDPLAL